MLTYVVRRLLLMIPTILGITFLVFLLLASAPGGIGAAGAQAGGGPVEGSKRAAMEAYFEDRYGVKDPILVQYGRWLGRISPVKFGTRDQVTPAGEHKSAPREVDRPPLLSWFPLSELATTAEESAERSHGDVKPVDRANREPEQLAYRRLETDYIGARGAYRTAIKQLGNALNDYAREKDIPGVRATDGDCRFERLAGLEPDRSAPGWPHIEALGKEVDAAYIRALASYQAIDRAFAAKPFDEAGIPILPGIVSLGAPDLGVAFSVGRPSSTLIGEALPRTLLLNLLAFPLIYLIAIPSGMLMAARRGTWFDIAAGGLFVGLWSIPVVWAGVLAIGFLASPQYLGFFPVSGLHDKGADNWTFLPSRSADGSLEIGYLVDALWHLVLPVACLTYGGFAILAKQTRAAMLDNYSADYVRTARAKGVDRRTVAIHHVFRNSLLPVITMFVTIFPAMLAGSVVVERIFTVPGMGTLLLDAINQRDRELVLANTLMVACVNLLALLAADILYAVADPRVSYE